MLLVVKLVLVPALVAVVTLGTRRWGPRVGGWLTGLPIVAGPTIFFLALEQGDAFAATAARTSLVGLIGVAAFALVYARTASGMAWPASLLAGWAAFAAIALTLHRLPWPTPAALGVACASFLLVQRLLPIVLGRSRRPVPPPWDLPLRMTGALGVVLAITLLAERLGPGLSGALATFPVALGVILAFTHAQAGPPAVVGLLRGFLPAMWGFALFCQVLALGLVPLGLPGAFTLALAAQLFVQAALLWWMTARRGPVPLATR